MCGGYSATAKDAPAPAAPFPRAGQMLENPASLDDPPLTAGARTMPPAVRGVAEMEESVWFSAGQLVFLGAAIQTLAMLFRDQVALRITYIVGGAIWIFYYLFALSSPLWEAALASFALTLATFYGLLGLLVGRSKLIIPDHLMGLYHTMGGLAPGEFRALMRAGQRKTVESAEVLTHEGAVPDKLYFVESGGVRAQKNSHEFALPPEVFIGEVAFMTGQPASATIELAAGAQLVEWDAADLKRRMRRNPRLRQALEARIARDMADKVARAVNHL